MQLKSVVLVKSMQAINLSTHSGEESKYGYNKVDHLNMDAKH